MKKLIKNNKGTVSFYITFFILAIVIITIGAVLAPAGVLFNTKMYAMGEDILLKANSSIADINDPVVKAKVYNITDLALDNAETNIETNANIFRYSWVFMIAITGLVLFIITRRVVEVQGGGGFI